MPTEVSLVITAYNSAETIGRTLGSVYALPSSEAPRETVVIDNASTDRTVEVVRGFPRARMLRSRRNLGLARANDLAASLCPPGSILFMNPDVEVLPGALPELGAVERLHPRAGVIGPRMVDRSGNTQSTARTFPGPLEIAARRTPLGATRAGRAYLERHMPDADLSAPSRADWLVGAALWVTAAGRERFGTMSRRYFLYFEDVDLCWRAWESGMEVWYCPSSTMVHVPRRQSAGRPGRALWLHLSSMVRFFADHPEALTGRCPRNR